MSRKTLTTLLSLAIMGVSTYSTAKAESTLFLVGGGLKTCSSMSLKNCNNNKIQPINTSSPAKKGNLYRVDKKSINYLSSFWFNALNNDKKRYFKKLFTTIMVRSKGQLLTKSALKQQLMRHDSKGLIRQLNDQQYYLLLDALEQPLIDGSSNRRLKEQVYLTQSTNQASTALYQEFVKLAHDISGAKKPNVLVLTASARDPFEAVDFYQAVFRQAGAQTTWLPLDATLNHLLQQKGQRQTVCSTLTQTRLAIQGSIKREIVYPDLATLQLEACLKPNTLLTAISQADGIFINGGDQSLTTKAFINADGTKNSLLQLIQEKLANNTLIVGGTSAGTAVMSGGLFANASVPMITNGQSDTAIVRGAMADQLPIEGCHKAQQCKNGVLNDDLTFNSDGGIRLFPWGILDTHFSERGRQGRLATLAVATKTRFAFGVDEATALIVTNLNGGEPTFRVLGQSGVYIVDNQKGDIETVMTHYLTHGDMAGFKDERLIPTFVQTKSPTRSDEEINTTIEDIFSGQRYHQASQVLCRTSMTKIQGLSSWQDNKHAIAITKGPDAISRSTSSNSGLCSYANYQLSISKH